MRFLSPLVSCLSIQLLLLFTTSVGVSSAQRTTAFNLALRKDPPLADSSVNASQEEQVPDDLLELPVCNLDCEHGGYCSYTTNYTSDNDWESAEHHEEQLALAVQSGQLIQTCICPPGFGGLGCEIRVEECQNGKCVHNGSPCTRQPHGLSGKETCDCAVADKVSKFAGYMCRKPYTEYCTSSDILGAENDDQEEPKILRFCTNGGKCKADFIAAQVAPGNTTVNAAYADAGCVCNPAFYGPHCEFLDTNYTRKRWGKDDEIELGIQENTSSSSSKGMDSSKVILLSISSVLVFLAAMATCRRRHRRRQRRAQALAVGHSMPGHHNRDYFSDDGIVLDGGNVHHRSSLQQEQVEGEQMDFSSTTMPSLSNSMWTSEHEPYLIS